jgi:hypothetical protein
MVTLLTLDGWWNSTKRPSELEPNEFLEMANGTLFIGTKGNDV